MQLVQVYEQAKFKNYLPAHMAVPLSKYPELQGHELLLIVLNELTWLVEQDDVLPAEQLAQV